MIPLPPEVAKIAISASEPRFPLDPGNFALEEDGQVIADHIRRFLSANVKRGSQGRG